MESILVGLMPRSLVGSLLCMFLFPGLLTKLFVINSKPAVLARAPAIPGNVERRIRCFLVCTEVTLVVIKRHMHESNTGADTASHV